MKRETFLTPLEVKFDAGAGESMSFSGYGARFGNVDSYGDVIAPGAFTKTLQEARKSGTWPAMLSQHGGFTSEDNTPIGVWTELKEDDNGLWVEGKLAPTPRGQEIYTLMKMSPRPAIDGMSIGYRATEWTMRSKPDEPRRTLKAVDLVEVSLVTFPANGKARVSSVKSADEIKTIREFEDFLRDVGGYSHAAAKAIAAGGFKASNPRDEDDADAIAAILRRNIALLK